MNGHSTDAAGQEFYRDPGLQNERTALAWQRTALSMLAGSAILARLTWSSAGVSALALLTIAAALSLWVFVESRLRYAQSAGVRLRSRPRGGRGPLTVALATALIAGAELIALLS